MSDLEGKKPIRGFLFACTDNTEKEFFERMLAGTSKVYGPMVIRIREGDLIFLHNLDSDALYGIFKAASRYGINLQPEAWNGRYPYQVKVESIGAIIRLDNSRKILKKMNVERNTPVFGRKLISSMDIFLQRVNSLGYSEDERSRIRDALLDEMERIKKGVDVVDIEDEIPLVEATTLWDFPKQSFGLTQKGDNRYPGVTPAQLIWNLVWRYTDPGDLVVDPMCGSGTTIDVCKDEQRRVIGYDIAPTRPDIIQSDARRIPLDDDSVDLVFIDSPYGDNVRYNEHPDDIGKISSETEEFYDELEKVMAESHRILREGRVLGWLIGDQWVRKRFTPVGFKVYERLCKYFETEDIVCIARRGQASHTAPWFSRARRYNFYLRGFKYLFIMRKKKDRNKQKPSEAKWTRYK